MSVLGWANEVEARLLAHLEGQTEDALASPLAHAASQGFRAFAVVFTFPKRGIRCHRNTAGTGLFASCWDILSVVLAFSAISATAQQPAAAPGGPTPRPPVEIDKTPPAEDFKPSSLNQPGKQYPEVNSQRRVRAVLKAPNAQNVMLDLGGVRYPMTKGEDSVWTGVSNAQDEGFHYYQLNVDGVSVPDPAR